MLFLGWMLKKTLHEIAEMSLDEFELWLAYFRMCDPERINDARFAGIQATLHQGFWPQECGYSTSEFMPAEAKDAELDDDKEVERKARSWGAAHGKG